MKIDNQQVIKKFNEMFGIESGTYYGRDLEGGPMYIPSLAIEEIESFIDKVLSSQKESLRKKIEGMKLTEISKAFDGEDIRVETYNDKMVYNQALLDILKKL